MALPDYFKNEAGTAKSWKSSGGDYAITLASLTNGSAREGAKGDLGSAWARRWAVMLATSVGAAATNGNAVELWWGPSTSATAGTDNPANLTGADAALANPDEVKFQAIFIGALVLSNARGTNIQKVYFDFYPPTRYGTPFIVNKSGQTLGATAGDHEIRLTPVEENQQDTV
jgi:hypothetical protein